MFGIHVTKKSLFLQVNKAMESKTMLAAIKANCSIFNITAVQIFTHGPRNSAANNINKDAIKEYCKKNHICIVVHASYMSNIWKDTAFVRKHMQDQLQAANALGAIGLVIHLPKEYNGDIVERIMKKILDNKPLNCPILLETECSKQIDYTTPFIINDICKRLGAIKGWGLCIDTAHIWASGANISTSGSLHSWLKQLTKCALSKIKLLHLNGSPVELNSGRDIHMIAGSPSDKIWGHNKQGLLEIIQWANYNKICIISEINRGTYEEAGHLLKLK